VVDISIFVVGFSRGGEACSVGVEYFFVSLSFARGGSNSCWRRSGLISGGSSCFLGAVLKLWGPFICLGDCNTLVGHTVCLVGRAAYYWLSVSLCWADYM
jgi:hypothetical protein